MILELLIGTALAALATTVGAATIVPRAVRGRTGLSLVLAAAGGGLGPLLGGDRAGWLAGALVIAALPTVAAVAGRGSAWHGWARVTGSALVQAAVVYLGYAVLLTVATARGVAGAILGAMLLAVQAASLVLTLSFAFEILDVLGRRSHPARDAATSAPEPDRWPGVCIQVPAYNEPPELLALTIERLMSQDYPGRWMVQVVDNNTPDEATWRPIEELCRTLGDRVRFMHLADWPGFKSGALNEATRRLPDWVEVVSVVDADYLVDAGFLRATARHFADPGVAFVQTPQHYREWQGNRYLAGLFYSYKYFFDVSMASRHEHNAIIFGGTMGLIRRSALDEIGGWDEQCITEDAEASLRLLGRGYRGVYDPRSYGAGLMPLSFEGLKKQRFRWAFGGIQILRKHAGGLLGLPSRHPLQLTASQRLAYLLGGLQWFNEVLSIGFTAILLTAALTALVGGRLGLPALTGAALVVPPLLIATGVARTQWALRAASGCSARQALRAYLVFFAVSWVVARACFAGLVRRSGTFLRTPKVRGERAWQRAVAASSPETGIAAVCLLSAVGLVARGSKGTAALLAGFLFLQGVVYGSAPLCGLWAEDIRLTPTLRAFSRSAQNTGERPQVRRVVLRLGLALGIASAGVLALGLAVAAPAGVEPFSGGAAPDPGPQLGALAPAPGGSSDGGPATPSPTAHAATAATSSASPQSRAATSASAAAASTATGTATATSGTTPTSQPSGSPGLGSTPTALPTAPVTPRSGPSPHPTPR
ncbi:MAG: glycosyltransferase [Candidatus Dormibacteria bacterium]